MEYCERDPALMPKRLRELRMARKKSRIVVSELCGLHPDALRRYEAGLTAPSVDSLVRLAAYFGVSTDYLLGVEPGNAG